MLDEEINNSLDENSEVDNDSSEKNIDVSTASAEEEKEVASNVDNNTNEAEAQPSIDKDSTQTIDISGLTEADIVVKPLNNNKFLACFQKLYRWWLGVWYGFQDKHPTLAKWIYKIGFFFAFSMAVTVFQFIVMTFLPYAFGDWGKGDPGWPGTVLPFADKNGAKFIILGDVNGWGYFLAFEIATFLAQCINFPLQRNITYKSKGNPWFQGMWYFIGWILVSLFTNTIWGFINALLTSWGWYLVEGSFLYTVAGLLKTVLTGGVSMVIFFFVFMIVFPDLNKTASNSKKKADKLNAIDPSSEKAIAATEKAKLDLEKATKENARKKAKDASSLCDAKAVSYFAAIKKLQKMNEKMKTNPKITSVDIQQQEKFIENRKIQALEAIVKKNIADQEYQTVLAK